MTDAVKLKSCPFCGSEVKLHVGLSEFVDGEIHCQNDGCGATSGNHPDADSAIKAWNTRAEAAPSPDAVKIEPVGYVSRAVINLLRSGTGGCFRTSAVSRYDETEPLYGPDAMDRIKELEEALTLIASNRTWEELAKGLQPLTGRERQDIARRALIEKEAG